MSGVRFFGTFSENTARGTQRRKCLEKSIRGGLALFFRNKKSSFESRSIQPARRCYPTGQFESEEKQLSGNFVYQSKIPIIFTPSFPVKNGKLDWSFSDHPSCTAKPQSNRWVTALWIMTEVFPCLNSEWSTTIRLENRACSRHPSAAATYALKCLGKKNS